MILTKNSFNFSVQNLPFIHYTIKQVPLLVSFTLKPLLKARIGLSVPVLENFKTLYIDLYQKFYIPDPLSGQETLTFVKYLQHHCGLFVQLNRKKNY